MVVWSTSGVEDVEEGRVLGARDERAASTSSSALRRSVRRFCKVVIERVVERSIEAKSSLRELEESSSCS